MKGFFQLLAIATFILLVTAQTSYAYIDPGSGSMVMMAILGFFAAVGFTLRKYFYRIRGLFGGGKSGSEKKQGKG